MVLMLEEISGKIKEFGSEENVKSLNFPDFIERDSKAVANAVQSGMVSTYGEQTRLFEEKLSELLGGRVIATNSGTSALHLAVLTIQVGPGDIVFCPAISFVATANSILYAGATPYFIDVDQDSMLSSGVLRRELESGFRKKGTRWIQKDTGMTARAVMILHPFGTLLEATAIREVAEEFNLAVIEDGAQALGSGLGNSRQLGDLGRIAAISFNGNKILTTGAGGALLTKNEDDYRIALKLATVAREGGSSHEVGHDLLGFNYRMPSLNAALGLSALDRLEETLVRKRRVRGLYQAISSEFNLDLLHQAEVNSNFWLNVLGLPQGFDTNSGAEKLNGLGIGVRKIWKPLPRLKHLSKFGSSDLSMSHKIYENYLCFPSSPAMAQA